MMKLLEILISFFGSGSFIFSVISIINFLKNNMGVFTAYFITAVLFLISTIAITSAYIKFKET